MRTRRQFRPTFDSLCLRIAPSDFSFPPNPMDPTSIPNNPPPLAPNPMDPTSTPGSGPATAEPTIGGPGSFNPPDSTSGEPQLC